MLSLLLPFAVADTPERVTPADMPAMSSALPALQQGAYTHTVPMELPPAPASSAPDLSLVADFRVTDGPVGTGWMLSGLSRIELRSDTGGVPRLDGSDVPYADGMRLWWVLDELLSSYPDFGYYGIVHFTGEIWAPEMDDGRLFDYDDEANIWRARRDGWTWTYGQIAAEGVGAAATEFRNESGAIIPTCTGLCSDLTTAWLLSKVEDPNGNVVTLGYSTTGRDEGGAALPEPTLAGTTDPVISGDFAYQHLPDAIVYANGHNEVRFVWEPRPDVLADARSGRPRVLAARLSAIESTGGGEVFSRYELSWAPDETVSRLEKIERVGTDGARRTLREVTTDEDLSGWEDGGWTVGGEGSVTHGTFADAPTSTRHSAVNFDGDPTLDLVRITTQCEYNEGEDRPYSCPASERGFRRTNGTTLAGTSSDPEVDLLDAALPAGFFADGGAHAFVDIDRDGDTDVLTATPDATDCGRAWSLLSDGSIQEQDLSLCTYLESDRLLRFGQFADVDADGFVDLVVPPVDELDDVFAWFGWGDATVWMRNSGAAPFLAVGDAEELVIDFELPFGTFDDAVDECLVNYDDAVEFPDWGASDYFFYTSALDYRAGQARWRDVNGDGVADVTYSLWSCWENSDSDQPRGEDAFSHVYLGDGTGNFVDSGFGAGLPYEPGWIGEACASGSGCWPLAETHESNALADLHRSGRLDLIEQDEAGLGASAFAGVAAGFATTDHDLPVTSLFRTVASESETTAAEVLVADFDGDGFTDFFDARFGEMQSKTRAVARHRTTTIEDAYGGDIALTYSTTTLTGENPDLPWPVDVVASVTDQNGTSAYTFEGGNYLGAENRFLGFRDALVAYEHGGTSNFRFGVKPWADGRLVYQADHRADGSLERFQSTSYRHVALMQISVDTEPPYWNPPLRQCDVYVGPADASGNQSVDEGDLWEKCDTYGAGPTLDWDILSDLHGWSGDDDAIVGVPPVTQRWDLSMGTIVIDGVPDVNNDGSYQAAATYGDADSFPPLSGSAQTGVVVPTDPARAERVGLPTTLTVMHLRSWSYDAYHRPTATYDGRDVSVPDDNVVTTLTYDTFDWERVGEERIGEVQKDATGATLRAFTYIPAGNTFDQPEWTTEIAASGRTWRATYDRGEVASTTDPDGVTETFTRNECGQIETRLDAAGRTETIAWDDTCRKLSRTWEGATTTWTYDGLGRTESETATPHVGTPVMQRWHRNDSQIDDDSKWDAVEVYPDDSIRQTFLDEWGREVKSVTCPKTGAWASTSENALTYDCEPFGADAEKVVTARGYATDGSLRYTSAPYACVPIPMGTCDDAPAAWTYADEQGRVLERLDPAPIDPIADPLTFVQTSTAYVPGEVRVVDAMGLECQVAFNTLDRSWSCDGIYRGAETRNALGFVVEEQDGAGTTWEYEYDDWWRIERRRLAAAHAVSTVMGTTRAETRWTWTEADRDLSVKDDDNNTRSWTYDTAGRKQAEWFQPNGGPLRRVWQWTRWNHASPFGHAVFTTDIDNNVTVESFDGLGRTLLRAHPDATTESWTRDSRGWVTGSLDRRGATTTTDYDTFGRTRTVTDPLGKLSTFEYDAGGRVIEATDADGVTTLTDYAWSGLPLATYRGTWTLAEWVYGDDARVLEMTEDGVRTTYGYDPLGRRISECVGYDGVDCGIEREWTHTDADFVETSSIGGNVTTYTTNRLGWVTETEHPDGSSIVTHYDDLGQVVSVFDEEGLETVRDYDGWGRLTNLRRPGEGDRFYEYAHDYAGTHRFLVREIAPDGGEWTTQYDAFGRVVASENPFGEGVERDYDGPDLSEVRHLDPTGTALAHEGYWWDARGQIEMRAGPVDAAEWATLGSGVPDPSTVHGYAYTWTDAGRLHSREGPNDLTTWSYVDGEVVSEEISGVSTVTYGYQTLARNLASKFTSDGTDTREAWYSWNRGMRLAAVFYDDGATTMQDEYYGWDEFSRPLSSRRWNGGVLESQYAVTTDNRGRVETVGLTANGTPAGIVNYDWYDNDELSRVATTWAGTLHYNRWGGHLQSITDGSGITLASFSAWDDLGRAGHVATLGGRTIDRTWGLDGKIETLDTHNGVITQSRTYGYDHRGRVASLSTTQGLMTIDHDWVYGEPGWLEQETRVTTGALGATTEVRSWAYDDAGNRLTATTSAGTTAYGYAYGNRLTSVGGVALTWDGTGQLTDDHRGYSFVRNPDGSELGIDDAAGPLFTFTRDPYGRPIQSEDDAGTLRTVVWGNPEADLPLAGVGELGAPILNVAADGLLLGRVQSGLFVPMASDPLGTTVLDGLDLTPPTGAFGDEAAATSNNRHVYAGLESLEGTPFQLARHRLYDSGVGRFASMDPIGLAGGDHRFAYAENRPTGLADPSGLRAWTGTASAPSCQGTPPPPMLASRLTTSWHDRRDRPYETNVQEKLGVKCSFGAFGCRFTVGAAEGDPAGNWKRLVTVYYDNEIEEGEFTPAQVTASAPAPASPSPATDTNEGAAPQTTDAAPPTAGEGAPAGPIEPPNPVTDGADPRLPTAGGGGGGFAGSTSPAMLDRAGTAYGAGIEVLYEEYFLPGARGMARYPAPTPAGVLWAGGSMSEAAEAGLHLYVDTMFVGPVRGFGDGLLRAPQAIVSPFSNMSQVPALWSGDPHQARAASRVIFDNYSAQLSTASAAAAGAGTFAAVSGRSLAASRGIGAADGVAETAGRRFIVDPKGNALIEPPGGATVGNPAGTFVETRYPNGSPYQQLHSPRGEAPHGHGFQEGPGPNQRGPSLDVYGNVVPENSPAAHWPVTE